MASAVHWHNRAMRVALLGLGTVGAAVAARLLDEAWRADVEARGLRPPALVAVGVREPRRRRAVDLPEWVDRTDDLDRLVTRADVDVVVELLGGIEPPGRLIEAALSTGKSVVTANKALLAELGPALERVARRSAASLRLEAAVGGGIPILSPLARDLAAVHVRRVRGIVNGTTNFILSSIASTGADYGDALAAAQREGYAEADPSADVEGRDAAHKLVLLARLALGAWLQPSSIVRSPAAVGGDGQPGITGVRAAHVAEAAGAGLAIKLVASAERVAAPAGARLVGFVEPCAVPARSVIGVTDGPENVIEVVGEPVGRVCFRGSGAGGDATSSAVLADLLALQRGEGSTWASLPDAAAPVGDLDPAREGQERCWFVPGAGVVGPCDIDSARASLAGRGMPATTPIYRLLED